MTWVSPEQSATPLLSLSPQPQPWLQVREITQLRRSLKISGHSAGRSWGLISTMPLLPFPQTLGSLWPTALTLSLIDLQCSSLDHASPSLSLTLVLLAADYLRAPNLPHPLVT